MMGKSGGDSKDNQHDERVQKGKEPGPATLPGMVWIGLNLSKIGDIGNTANFGPNPPIDPPIPTVIPRDFLMVANISESGYMHARLAISVAGVTAENGGTQATGKKEHVANKNDAKAVDNTNGGAAHILDIEISLTRQGSSM